MNKCLVTKLQDVVGNASLPKLGEGRIVVTSNPIPSAATQKITLQFSEGTDIEIIGDGFFTDSALSINKGKSLHLNQYESTDVYFSNGNYEISFEKYKLVNISSTNVAINLDDVRYASLLSNVSMIGKNIEGDIAAFESKGKLTGINLRSKNVYGDLSALKDDAEMLYLNLLGTGVSGDLSALAGMTKVTVLNLLNTKARGDLSALAGMTKVTVLNLLNTKARGDLSALAGMGKLEDLSLSGVYGNVENIKNAKMIYFNGSTVSGDISKLPKGTYYLAAVADSGSSFTWTSRPSSNNIIAINATDVAIDNVDKMLQDQANCLKAYPSSGESWFKTISCKGTRTSASDSAVTELQSKGYTVSVTPVE